MAVHADPSRTAPPSPLPGPRPALEAGASHGRRHPALDGVRGLAIALVVMLHFTEGLDHAPPGGFLGVDLFFVLSGYLITGLLVHDWVRTGRLELGRFWLRRARRLLPPLLVVLVLVSWLLNWAAPAEDRPYQRDDALSTLFYSANFHLLSSVDAWGRMARTSVLGHTWSLAVEEQFYLVWPLLLSVLLMVGARLGRPRTPALAFCAVAGAASFAWLAVNCLRGAKDAAYFDTRGRVGELLAGAGLALVLPAVRRRLGVRLGDRVARLWGTVAVVAGLAVLVAACTLDHRREAYYLWGAAAVTLATASLVAAVEAAPDAAVARGLAWAPLAGLGKISYTLYLVHFPVRDMISLPRVPTAGAVLQVELLRLSLSLGFAVLSYQILERPLLAGTLPWLGRSRPRLALAGLSAVAATVVVILSATSLPGDLEAQIRALPAAECPGESPTVLAVCSLSDGPERWVVTGDDEAAGLAHALATVPRLGVTQAGWRSCGAGGVTNPPPASPALVDPAVLCARDTPPLVAEAVAQPGTSAVIVADATSAAVAVDAGGGRLALPGTQAHDRAVAAGLLRLIDADAARRVDTVLLRQPPPSAGLGTLVAPGSPAARSGSDEELAQWLRRYDEVLADVAAARPGWARVISVDDLVCPGGSCPALVDGLLVRHDARSFTPAFARRIAPTLAARVRAAVTPPRRAG